MVFWEISRINRVLDCLKEIYEKGKGSTNERISIVVFSNHATIVENCIDYSKKFEDIRAKILN